MTTTTTSIDIRLWREQLGLSRLALAVRAGVSPAWLQALEGGLQPVGSRALARVLEVLLAAAEASDREPA